MIFVEIVERGQSKQTNKKGIGFCLCVCVCVVCLLSEITQNYLKNEKITCFFCKEIFCANEKKIM